MPLAPRRPLTRKGALDASLEHPFTYHAREPNHRAAARAPASVGAMATRPRSQHYLPEFHLAQFIGLPFRRFHVFDKKTTAA